MSASFHRGLRGGLWTVLVLTSLARAGAQAMPPAQIARSAGLVFVGMVTSVERTAPQAPLDAAAVRITCRVEHGFRGSEVGQTVTFLEWAGLWTGSARYRLGQRYLLFLHTPLNDGFTSPVGGDTSRILLPPGADVSAAAVNALLLSPDDASEGTRSPSFRQPRNGRSIESRRPLNE